MLSLLGLPISRVHIIQKYVCPQALTATAVLFDENVAVFSLSHAIESCKSRLFLGRVYKFSILIFLEEYMCNDTLRTSRKTNHTTRHQVLSRWLVANTSSSGLGYISPPSPILSFLRHCGGCPLGRGAMSTHPTTAVGVPPLIATCSAETTPTSNLQNKGDQNCDLGVCVWRCKSHDFGFMCHAAR